MFKLRRPKNPQREPTLQATAAEPSSAGEPAISGHDAETSGTGPSVDLADGVLRLGRQRFAAGLMWSFRSEGQRIAEIAGKIGGQMSREFDLYVQISAGDSQEQLGLGTREEGHKPGMQVAALALDEEQRGGDCLCAFALGQTAWWIVAFQERAVVNDELVRDAGEAMGRFDELLQQRTWGRVVAPDEWDEAGFKHIPLEKMLRRGARLRAVAPLRMHRAKLLGLLLAVAVAGAGYYFWNQQREQERLEREAAAEAARESSRRGQVPWREAAVLRSFIEACQETMQSALFDGPGWVLTLQECLYENGRAGFLESWKRDGGRITWLDVAWRDRGGAADDVALMPNGEIASLALPVGGIARSTNAAAPLDGADIERLVRRRFQAFGLDVVIRDKSRKAAPDQVRKLKAPIFNYHEVTVSIEGGVVELANLFEGIPALVPAKLTFNPANGLWLLVVKVYHPPIMPPKN